MRVRLQLMHRPLGNLKSELPGEGTTEAQPSISLASATGSVMTRVYRRTLALDPDRIEVYVLTVI
jgi:hypothetical protein